MVLRREGTPLPRRESLAHREIPSPSGIPCPPTRQSSKQNLKAVTNRGVLPSVAFCFRSTIGFFAQVGWLLLSLSRLVLDTSKDRLEERDPFFVCLLYYEHFLISLYLHIDITRPKCHDEGYRLPLNTLLPHSPRTEPPNRFRTAYLPPHPPPHPHPPPLLLLLLLTTTATLPLTPIQHPLHLPLPPTPPTHLPLPPSHLPPQRRPQQTPPLITRVLGAGHKHQRLHGVLFHGCVLGGGAWFAGRGRGGGGGEGCVWGSVSRGVYPRGMGEAAGVDVCGGREGGMRIGVFAPEGLVGPGRGGGVAVGVVKPLGAGVVVWLGGGGIGEDGAIGQGAAGSWAGARGAEGAG